MSFTPLLNAKCTIWQVSFEKLSPFTTKLGVLVLYFPYFMDTSIIFIRITNLYEPNGFSNPRKNVAQSLDFANPKKFTISHHSELRSLKDQTLLLKIYILIIIIISQIQVLKKMLKCLGTK
jgi:hypothetical protein